MMLATQGTKFEPLICGRCDGVVVSLPPLAPDLLPRKRDSSTDVDGDGEAPQKHPRSSDAVGDDVDAADGGTDVSIYEWLEKARPGVCVQCFIQIRT